MQNYTLLNEIIKMKYYYLDFNQTLFVILKKKQTNKQTKQQQEQNKTKQTKQNIKHPVS